MASNTTDFKNRIAQKFLKLQLTGLEQYAKYLKQQLKRSGTYSNREAYIRYIEKEVIRNNKKIQSVNAKLK